MCCNQPSPAPIHRIHPGEMPATLGQLRNLKWLSLGDNKLSGESQHAKALYPPHLRVTTRCPRGRACPANGRNPSTDPFCTRLSCVVACLLHSVPGTIPTQLAALSKLENLWINDNKLVSGKRIMGSLTFVVRKLCHLPCRWHSSDSCMLYFKLWEPSKSTC